MSQGRGDLGPGSYSLLWFLHSKSRFKRLRLSLQTFIMFFSKTLTETFMQKYLPLVFDFHHALWKIHQRIGGNFKH